MFNLFYIFEGVNGNSFVSIDTETKVALKGGKSNPMKDRVTKRVTGSRVMVFQNKKVHGYESMVKRRLAEEGKDPNSFALGERKWGERIPNLPVVQHINKENERKFYLEVIFLEAGKVEYFLDGRAIDKEKIVGLEPAKVDEESQAGLENKVVVRTYSVDSIIGMRVNKQDLKGSFTYFE